MTVNYPTISPIDAAGGERPFWSVMISAYDRTEFIEHALTSVLQQAPPADEMQIEVLNDGAAAEIQAELEAIVQRVAGDRASFYRHPVNTGGGPDFANVCVTRARGQWVHLLHDDDLVRPGFYEALRRGIEEVPELGVAFCRQVFMSGGKGRFSGLERKTAGVLEGWLERIGRDCRIQVGSGVVRRAAYEAVGGFSPQLRGASDWEMWQRLAVHYPTWYEPEPLACYRQHENSVTGTIGPSGQHCAALRRVIDAMSAYIGEHRSPEFAEQVETQAREYYGEYALSLAARYLDKKEFEAAVLNLREALLCSPADELRQKISRLFRASRATHCGGTMYDADVFGDPNHIDYWAAIIKGEHQPQIYAILNKYLRSDSVYCDIGAGIGSTTIFPARKCKRVYCFESETEAYQHLLWNIRLNDLSNVTPFHLRLGGDAALPSIDWQTWMSLFRVEPIDFIHIDVGGGEAELLSQMSGYLAEHEPLLMVRTYASQLPAEEGLAAMQQVAEVAGLYETCLDENLNRVELNLLNSPVGISKQFDLLCCPS